MINIMGNKYGLRGNPFVERSQPGEDTFNEGRELIEQRGIPTSSRTGNLEISIEKYQDFIRMSRALNPENIFDDTSGKTEALRNGMGYSHLIGERGRRVRLEDCSEAKIGNAFKNTYNTAMKKLSRQR